MIDSLLNAVSNAQTIGITGHLHPDGDCVGSCMALYRYLKKEYPEKSVSVFLETPPENLCVLADIPEIDSTFTAPELPFDLFVVLDCSSTDRFPAAREMVEAAGNVYVVDHHMTNTHFAKEGVVEADASSTCEVLFNLLDEEKIDTEIATALYMGIVHDTGVFKYSCCTERTMRVAGRLLTKGVDAQRLIDDTFYRKTFLQNRLIGYALLHSQLMLDGKMIVSSLSAAEMAQFGAAIKDTEGIIDQLRLTEGIEVAVFAREDAENTYKISMRAISAVNVASICENFGGGGHRLAGGCTVTGDLADILTQISAMVFMQL
ncbi:MAG: DHH family phosphoesterase [Lachnospiraceae bacterium]|nr:DHH family phosphoesterase [Lachnospiraceae bacterium]